MYQCATCGGCLNVVEATTRLTTWRVDANGQCDYVVFVSQEDSAPGTVLVECEVDGRHETGHLWSDELCRVASQSELADAAT
jgi:hypothetical protein